MMSARPLVERFDMPLPGGELAVTYRGRVADVALDTMAARSGVRCLTVRTRDAVASKAKSRGWGLAHSSTCLRIRCPAGDAADVVAFLAKVSRVTVPIEDATRGPASVFWTRRAGSGAR
jgi:hypothetical protein